MSLLGKMLGLDQTSGILTGMMPGPSFNTQDNNVLDTESHGPGGLSGQILRQQLGRDYHAGGGRMPTVAAPVAPSNPFENLPFMNDWGMTQDPSAVKQPDQNNPATWTDVAYTPGARTMEQGLADQGFGAGSEQAKAFAQLKQPAGTQSVTTPTPVAPQPQTASAATASPHDSPSNEMIRQSIKDIESSGGNYRAVGNRTKTGDRAYGAYQVMGANIGPWTQQVLGRRLSPQEFLASPEAQDKVFDEIFGEAVKAHGLAGAASTWFTGSPTPKGKTDVNGMVDNVYVERFMKGLGQPLRYSNNNNRHGTGELETGVASPQNSGQQDFMQPRPAVADNAPQSASGGVQAENGATPEQMEQMRQMSLKERLALLAQFMQLGGFKPGEGSING